MAEDKSVIPPSFTRKPVKMEKLLYLQRIRKSKIISAAQSVAYWQCRPVPNAITVTVK